MIVLADNDILIKLAGCNLLKEFLDFLQAEPKDIFITNEAKYSIPKKSKKKISDDTVRQELIDFVEKLQVISAVQNELLIQVQSFDKMDGGEARLMLAIHNYPNAYFITGDKNCLTSLIQNKDKSPLTDIFNLLKQRVYCFENALLRLIKIHGFHYINNKIMDRCTDDGILRLAFGQNKTETECILCLSSYCRELSSLLANVDLIDKE